MSNTTITGTTVTVEDRHDDRVAICDNPAAPDDMRNTEVGRIVDGGFQPAFMCAFALSPEVLRIIAELAEGEATP